MFVCQDMEAVSDRSQVPSSDQVRSNMTTLNGSAILLLGSSGFTQEVLDSEAAVFF